MRTIIFFIGLMTISITSECQKYDLRLVALQYFCSNKSVLFPTENAPIFVVDLEINDNGEAVLVSTLSHQSGSLILIEELISKHQRCDTILSADELSLPSGNGHLERLSDVKDVCTCVYQTWRLYDDCDSVFSQIEDNCYREYKLEISDIITIDSDEYVVLKVSSFFLGQCNGIRFIAFQFEENKMERCYVGRTWTS